jgi:hypothetical protein
VAHARNVRLIGESRRKDDRLDAQTLARLANRSSVAVSGETITIWSLAKHFSMIRGGNGAETTPRSSHEFSLPGPYFAIRTSRSSSSSKRIFSSAYCSLF